MKAEELADNPSPAPSYIGHLYSRDHCKHNVSAALVSTPGTPSVEVAYHPSGGLT